MGDDMLGWLIGASPFFVLFYAFAFAALPAEKKPTSAPEEPEVDSDAPLHTLTVLFLALLITCTKSTQVRGRRTGLSEHAFPFGQTERRAKRTLDRAPP